MTQTFVLSMLLSGLGLTVGACSSTPDQAQTETPSPNPEPSPDNQQPGNGRALVVYFSCTNTTKGIADRITGITHATSCRIVPAVAYTSVDLDYNNSSSRTNREHNDASSRPAISGKIEGLSDYDVIFVGYPLWWGEAPKIISTFLESYDFSGKIIVPFCTSHSSAIGSSDTDLHGLASKAIWKPGKRFSRNATNEEIKNWIESLDLNPGNAGSFDLSNGENDKAPTVTLNSGYQMPIVGLGT